MYRNYLLLFLLLLLFAEIGIWVIWYLLGLICDYVLSTLSSSDTERNIQTVNERHKLEDDGRTKIKLNISFNIKRSSLGSH